MSKIINPGVLFFSSSFSWKISAFDFEFSFTGKIEDLQNEFSTALKCVDSKVRKRNSGIALVAQKKCPLRKGVHL